MGKKVAFLSLNYQSFENEELMGRFFCEEHKDKYNLYIHNKEPIVGSIFEKYCIPENYKVETEWGKYSLVLATIRLMKYALQDPDNEKFILISNSHCPLHSIDKICEKIWSHFPLMSFDRSIVGKFDASCRYDLILDPSKIHLNPFKRESSLFVAQWFMCNRSDAEFFVANEARLRSWFNLNRRTWADESYFSMIANHYGLPYQIKTNCYVAWRLKTKKQLVAQGKREMPCTFDRIPNKMIDILRKRDILFLRKICAETQLDIDYLLQ